MSNANESGGTADSRRFKLIPVENLSPEQRKLYDAIRSGPRAKLANSGAAKPGPLGGPFNVWLRSPGIGDCVQRLGEEIRFRSSLPPKFRPLPGRTNIVVTRQPAWQADGAFRADSLLHALELCPHNGDAWVLGGAEIYRAALPLAHTAVVTEIDAPFEGDVYAPAFGPAWRELRREAHIAANGLAFSFVTYQNTARGD